MNMNTRIFRLLATIAAAVASLSFASITLADPPSRAARIGYMQGPVSFAPAGDYNWVEARLNRPITIGDSLWTDDNARTELQFGTAIVRLDEYTSVQLLNLDDRAIQIQLAQGRVNVTARSLRNGDTIEIATPNVAFTIREAGDYRIDVDPRDYSTTVSVRRGAGDVYGEGEAFTLRNKDVARFFGTDLRQREFYSLAPRDDFDRWASDRDRRTERSVSARYVSTEVVGYADLDQYGSWSSQPSYGNVWFPREVSREWAPYRYGHWSWIDPWGWSWVDDAPWGFAPFHYGRWSSFDGRWGWVPGPINVRPVYAPALVAFVGGANFSLSISSGPVGNGIGWFPLAPGEVYRPAYAASRDYVRNVNISNTVVNTTVINNIYNNQNTITQVNYRNAQVENAVTAVPPAVFAQSQSVQRGMVAVTPELLRRGQVTTMAAVAPTSMGIAGGAPATNRKPARTIQEREVVVRTAPPAAIAPVAQRVDLLQRQPGQPLERAAIITTTPTTASPNVRVVNQQTPQAVPQGTPRATGAPPPMVQRSANDVARPAPQAGRDNAPPNAMPAAPTAVVPPGAMPSRERGGLGNQGVAPPVPAPQPMSRDRGAPTPPAAAVPAPMTPQVVAPPSPQASPQSSTPPDRGRGGFDRPQGNRPQAPMPAPAAVAPTPAPAPAAVMPAPAAVAPAPPPPRAAPVPTPQTDGPSPQRQREQGQREQGQRERGQSMGPGTPPQQAAPQQAPQAMPQTAPMQPPAPPAAVAPPQMQRPAAPPAAAPAPTPRPPPPAAAPAMQPQPAPQAAPGGAQELQRRGRGKPGDDDSKDKDKEKEKDKK